MKLGAKHQNQSPLVRSDFSGGLNTSSNVDGIAENQLASAINVEIDSTNGMLKTVAGTSDIFMFANIFAAAYDEINQKLLVINDAKKVFAADLTTGKIGGEIGTLSGDLYPISARWEDGLLLASGGKLQYYNGKTFDTMTDSPNATSVYIRTGRVLVTDENNLICSGVGDESNWTEDTNDDSSSKFVEIGYKDGGKLLGMVNLTANVLFIKDNRMLYRLSGEFPNWSVSEVSRNVEARSRLGICSIADSVFILGRNEIQNVQTTNAYGDMKPANVATAITQEVQSLSPNAPLRFLPPLNQIWAINGRNVMMYDIVRQCWFKRQFNSPVIDAIPVGNEVLIIKGDRVSKLNSWSFSDAGEPLHWAWQSQRLLSMNDYFLKRTQVSFTPMDRRLSTGQIRVGAVTVDLPALEDENSRRRFLTTKGVTIYRNTTPIYGNPQPIFNRPTILVESRNVYRSKYLDISGLGTGGGMFFNAIILTCAEV